MSNSTLCFHSNPDISGIGVRSAVYAQNLLSFIPALFALSDGEVTLIELDTLETQSTTIIISAFALLISTIVQALNSNHDIRLSNFHATIILNLSWMNNTNLFIYFTLYVHNRLADLEKRRGGDPYGLTVRGTWKKEMKKALWNPVFILGSAHLTLMAAVGIWFWRRPFSFGFAPSCSRSASVVVLGHQVSLTSAGFKGWSLFVYSLLLVPIFNLVVPVTFFSIPFLIWPRVANRLNLAGRQHVPTMFGLIVLVVINIVFLADTEVTLRENSRLVGEGDTDWTFGQTLALLLLLVPFRDITETLVKRRPRAFGKKLLEASRDGKLQVVEYVCNLGADSKMKDLSLWIAAENDHRDVVRFLLRNGAGVNARDESGNTLIQAISWGDSEVVELLIKNNADVNARDKKGNTPLITAVSGGHSEVVELLLKNNANIEASNYRNSTALIMAAFWGHSEVVKLLLKYNANTEVSDKEGNTPLIMAVFWGHSEAVKLLLKYNANTEVSDKEGNTPLRLAAMNGHRGVVDLLEAYINSHH